MKTRLYLRLPSHKQGTLSWAIKADDSDAYVEQGELLSVDLVALVEKSQKMDVVVIVPASLVTLKQVITPAKQLKQIQRAVPFMLEDQVASGIDALHFAYGKRGKHGDIEVAFCSKMQLQHWLDWFNQIELKVKTLLVEQQLLQGTSDATEIILLDDMALVSQIDGKRWSCQRDLLPLLWSERPATTNNDSEANDLSQSSVRVFHDGELESFWHDQAEVIAQPITPQDWLKNLIGQIDKQKINLLQGEFAVKKESNLQWQKFKSIGVFACIALVMFIGLRASQWYTLNNEYEQLQTQGESLFQKVFSRRARAGDLLGQAERLLKRGGKEDEPGEFLHLLNETSKHLEKAQTIKPTSATFDGKKSELRVDILGPDYSALNQFKDLLQNNGLKVDMSSASAQGDSYSSRITIRRD